VPPQSPLSEEDSAEIYDILKQFDELGANKRK